MLITLRSAISALMLAMAAADPASASDVTLRPGADLALLNRLTWGATASDAQLLRVIGPEKWLSFELHSPEPDRLPPEVEKLIDALPMPKRTSADLARELAVSIAAAKASQANAQVAPEVSVPGSGKTAAAAPSLSSPQEVRKVYLADA